MKKSNFNRPPSIRLLLLLTGFILCMPTRALEGTDGEQGDWRYYGSTADSSKYSPLDQIDRENVDQLRVAWCWKSIDEPVLKKHSKLWTMVNEATPLAVGGKLYTSTSLNQVAAI